jgi:hypothetical protein
VNLPLLPQDKANHAVYGAAIAAVGLCYSLEVGAGLCVFFAVGKEISDWWLNRRGGNHGVEIADAAATIFGGALVLLPQVLRKFL